MGAVRLIVATAVAWSCAVAEPRLPLSRTLAAYIAAWTGGAPNATVAAKGCVAATLLPGSPLRSDAVGQPAGQSPEAFMVRTLLVAHPREAAPLAACLVWRGLVPPAVYAQSGSALLFAAAAFVGATPDPAALFAGLAARGAARNYTLGEGEWGGVGKVGGRGSWSGGCSLCSSPHQSSHGGPGIRPACATWARSCRASVAVSLQQKSAESKAYQLIRICNAALPQLTDAAD